MGEAMSLGDLLVGLIALGCVVAVISVVTWHFSRPKPAAGGQHAVPGPYAPRVAEASCLRCGTICDGYDMTVPGQPKRTHWQHRQPPADMHLAAVLAAEPLLERAETRDLRDYVTASDPWPQETATPCGQQVCEHAPDGGNHPVGSN